MQRYHPAACVEWGKKFVANSWLFALAQRKQTENLFDPGLYSAFLNKAF
jgi:hypothetical protein